MRVRVLSISLAALLSIAVAAPATAITNGTPDGDGHPYVGALIFDTLIDGVQTPTYLCTGALISPTVVLTAGHCTLGAVAARAWFQSDVSTADPAGGPGSGAYEGTPYAYPKWVWGIAHGELNWDNGDIAVVVLSQPVTNVSRYAQLPTAGIVDTLANKTAVDLVGFGAQFKDRIPGKPSTRWDGMGGLRYFASTESISGKFNNSDNYLRVSQNKGGTCFCDSGGPDLLGGTDTVLAVNTTGPNGNCAGVAYDTRTDLPDRLDWINGFVE